MNIRTERARALRRNMTEPERRLWRKLRSRQLFGLKFKRQIPIGPYIVDFLCEECGIVVEVDGETHASQVSYDRCRDRYLNRAGFYVLRVGNADVMENWEGVLLRIAQVCGR